GGMPGVEGLLDGVWTRGYADAYIGGWLQEGLRLSHASSLRAWTDLTPRRQVVYLVPRFPHWQRGALGKKEMRVFQALVGPDLYANGLLEPSRQVANKRVGVKRTEYPPPLAEVVTPTAILTTWHGVDTYAGTPLTKYRI
ncbi:class I SAM-dependent methyltransferase, partial [Salmonella enterica]|uniref:class I SAM-dependent methyltransferase n=1 Tax=Salmonella enterica TaxID=28901 RepID=UPI00398C5600